MLRRDPLLTSLHHQAPKPCSGRAGGLVMGAEDQQGGWGEVGNSRGFGTSTRPSQMHILAPQNPSLSRI